MRRSVRRSSGSEVVRGSQFGGRQPGAIAAMAEFQRARSPARPTQTLGDETHRCRDLKQPEQDHARKRSRPLGAKGVTHHKGIEADALETDFFTLARGYPCSEVVGPTAIVKVLTPEAPEIKVVRVAHEGVRDIDQGPALLSPTQAVIPVLRRR